MLSMILGALALLVLILGWEIIAKTRWAVQCLRVATESNERLTSARRTIDDWQKSYQTAATQRDTLLMVLRDVEWSGNVEMSKDEQCTAYETCPWCGGYKSVYEFSGSDATPPGHTQDCKLGNLLAAHGLIERHGK